jgi:hypothetical protein
LSIGYTEHRTTSSERDQGDGSFVMDCEYLLLNARKRLRRGERDG